MKQIRKFQKTKLFKAIIFNKIAVFLAHIIVPGMLMSLTSGPSQPEFQGFSPIGTSNMVNTFTGDFQYNIPILNLPGPNGGYPFNLSYTAGINMNQEASWVGLGWSLNSGSLTRQLSGVPDEFDGTDKIRVKNSMKDNWTLGFRGGVQIPNIFALDPNQGNLDPNQGNMGAISLGIRYNSYRGLGFNLGFPFIGAGPMNSSISLDSEGGIGVNVNFSFDLSKRAKGSIGISLSGEGNLGYSTGMSFSQVDEKAMQYIKTQSLVGLSILGPGDSKGYKSKKVKMEKAVNAVKSASNSGISYGGGGYLNHNNVLGIGQENRNFSVDISFDIGTAFAGVSLPFNVGGNFSTSTLKKKGKWVEHSAFGYENLEKSVDQKKEIYDFYRSKSGTIHKDAPNLGYPILSSDSYSSTAHGLTGSFRAWRTDVGKLHDPRVKSETGGFSLAFDLNPMVTPVYFGNYGVGLTVPFGHNEQKALTQGYDGDLNTIDFQSESDYGLGIEKSYYAMTGEKSIKEGNEFTYIGGLDDAILPNDISWVDNSKETNIANKRNSTSRVRRSTAIHRLTNLDLKHTHKVDDGGVVDDIILDMMTDGNPSNNNPSDILSSFDAIPEYEVFYYDWDDVELGVMNPDQASYFSLRDEKWQYLDKYKRGREIGGVKQPTPNHYSGFTNTTLNGVRYNYALPAYNSVKIDNLFSVDPSKAEEIVLNEVQLQHKVEFDVSSGEVDYDQWGHKFIQKKDHPPYAHSYLLTSILGADYVDLTNDGPTPDDLGYWVKFDYVKYSDDYKWRVPFTDANYSPEKLTTDADDKGTYAYGEKEMWYLGRAETASHVVIFHLSERKDNCEAQGEFATGTQMGTRTGLKVDKISLYTRDNYYSKNPNPIQETHFKYTYELCKGIPNYNDNITDLAVTNYISTLPGSSSDYLTGKLTLREVYTTYNGNSRGAASPYRFEYNNFSIGGSAEVMFDEHSTDRWGNYQDYGLTDPIIRSREFSYVDQNDSRANLDKKASNWSINKIFLPSGGEMNIDYEADDYAYVQDKQAAEMFEIVSINDNTTGDDVLYTSTNLNFDDNTEPESRRIYFKLKDQSINVSSFSDQEKSDYVYSKYIDPMIKDNLGNTNLYYKVKTNFREDIWDFVSGYVKLEENKYIGGTYTYGMVNDSGTKLGYLTISRPEKKTKNNGQTEYFNYHPFALAAWQHMKVTDPFVLNAPNGTFSDLGSNPQASDVNNQLMSLFSFGNVLQQQFNGYRNYCRNHDFAQTIDLDNSVIRLASPEKTKVGGGLRVKSVAISDNWNDMGTSQNESTYGLVYDYSVGDIDPFFGDEILVSSGVAAYEPLKGGDELATRYPRYHTNRLFLKSNENLFNEFPYNEEFMPSPVVGYSKVQVKSLNTQNALDSYTSLSNIQGGISSVEVSEFYTAKDFPVVYKETKIEKTSVNLNFPVPFVGVLNVQDYQGAQGYFVETNDMHGKPKSVKTFAFDENLSLKSNPEKGTEFEYYSYTDGKGRGRLQNQVPVLTRDITVDNTPYMGVNAELWTDQNKNYRFYCTAGANIDADIFMIPVIFVPLPVITGSGSFSFTTQKLKTIVTNKVVNRSGIVKKVKTFNGDYSEYHEALAFDEFTGEMLLSKQSNQFKDDIYQLKIPAHWDYEGMGPAYTNIGMNFHHEVSGSDNIDITNSIIKLQDIGASSDLNAVEDKLFPGDELLITIFNNTVNRKAVYLGKDNGKHIFSLGSNSMGTSLDSFNSGDDLIFEVIRSGKRNILDATGSSYMVLNQNPIDQYGDISNIDNTSFKNLNEYSGDVGAVPTKFFDNVIQASATKYKSTWLNIEIDQSNNAFESNSQGVWQVIRSYVNTTEREYQSGLDSDLKNDGVMNHVSFFNQDYDNWNDFDDDWIYSSESTATGAKTGVTEVVNRIGIYSSSVLSHKENLVIAEGVNVRNQEFGAESFESYEDGDDRLLVDEKVNGNLRMLQATNSNNDLNFNYTDKDHHTYIFEDAYIDGFNLYAKIKGGQNVKDRLQGASTIYVELRGENINSDIVKIAKLDSPSFGTVGSNGEFTVQAGLDPDFGLGLFANISDFISVASPSEVSGSIHCVYSNPSHSVSNLSFDYAKVSNDFAHTGKKSLKLSPADRSARLPQFDLQLEPGKEYVYSFWVNMESSVGKKMDYENYLNIALRSDGSAISHTVEYKSPVINGWQQYSVRFTYNNSTNKFAPIEIDFSGLQYVAFIDDVRISPAKGGIKSYVYDFSNYRLAAVLDERNFATFYYYSSEGDLFLTKVETEEGVHTVSENRKYSKPN